VVAGVEAHLLDPAADAVVAGELGEVGSVLVARGRGRDGLDHGTTEGGGVAREPPKAIGGQRTAEYRL
jgi:hypothetical protein